MALAPGVGGQLGEDRHGNGRVGDAVPRGQLQDPPGVGHREGHDPGAHAQRHAQRQAEAHHVGEGDGRQRDGVGVEPQAGGDLRRGGGEVGVGEADALGEAAGAAGERHHRQVRRRQAGLGDGIHAAGLQERLQRRGPLHLAVGDDLQVDPGLHAGLAQERDGWAGGHRHPGTDPGQRPSRLLGGPAQAEGRDGGAGAPDPERDHRPPGCVRQRDRDQVSAADAPLGERRGQRGRVRGQLAPRAALAGGAVDDRGPVGIGGRAPQRAQDRRWLDRGRWQGASEHRCLDHGTIPLDVDRFVTM